MIRFAELVFHVLAHVPGRVAASVFDPAYVAFVEEHAGPAPSRTLAEDVAMLAGMLPDHATFARVQLLAWVWSGASRAPLDRTLEELSPGDVDDPLAHAAIRTMGAAAEILRAAAELEAEVVASLPPPTLPPEELTRALATISAAAPHVRSCTVDCVRALRLRGRVRGRTIWVGAPCTVLGPTPDHAAWQAAHEATVAEVSERARAQRIPHDHDALEHASLVLLAERARVAGLADPHARWLSHLSDLPPLDRDAVPEKWRALSNPVGMGRKPAPTQ